MSDAGNRQSREKDKLEKLEYGNRGMLKSVLGTYSSSGVDRWVKPNLMAILANSHSPGLPSLCTKQDSHIKEQRTLMQYLAHTKQ